MAGAGDFQQLDFEAEIAEAGGEAAGLLHSRRAIAVAVDQQHRGVDALRLA